MAGGRIKRPWLDPNREGKSARYRSRFCARCGNSARKVRILKAYNLCEFCYQELVTKKDGIWTCRSCGRLAPAEVKKNKGYCDRCVCRVCGQPDPEYVKKTRICRACAAEIGGFCRKCGKEASAQVRGEDGLCDSCRVKHGQPIS